MVDPPSKPMAGYEPSGEVESAFWDSPSLVDLPSQYR